MACNKLFIEVNDADTYGILMRQNCQRSTWYEIKSNQGPKQGQPPLPYLVPLRFN